MATSDKHSISSATEAIKNQQIEGGRNPEVLAALQQVLSAVQQVFSAVQQVQTFISAGNLIGSLSPTLIGQSNQRHTYWQC